MNPAVQIFEALGETLARRDAAIAEQRAAIDAQDAILRRLEAERLSKDSLIAMLLKGPANSA